MSFGMKSFVTEFKCAEEKKKFKFTQMGLDIGATDVSPCNVYHSIPGDQRQMAISARLEFKKANYSSCLQILRKLLAARPHDIKVFHNICVAEYFSSNCRDTHEFYDNMVAICKQAHIDEDFDLSDDVDPCIVFYNRAVILFHLHKYEAAVDILDKVFQFSEPLEEALTFKICFLLMELYLCTNQPQKALTIGVYVETTILPGGNKGNNCGKTLTKEIPDNIVKAKLAQYKARCYTMMKTFKPCKREVKAMMASGVQDQHVAGLFIKSQLEYFRNNHKKALRIINSAQYPKNTSEHFFQTGDLLKAMHWNNIGCIHYGIDKSSLGAHYIHSAIKTFQVEQILLRDTEKVYPSNQPIHTLRGEVMYRLFFNLGMMNFKSKKFTDAFYAFVKATDLYKEDPQLWLRIAECCICLYDIKQGNLGITNKMKIVKQCIGLRIYKKAILNPCLETLSFSLITRTLPVVAPSLNYALYALKNAWHYLLPSESTSSDVNKNSSVVTQSSDEKEENHVDEPSCLPIPPSHIVYEDEVQKIRNFILVNASYVSLRNGDVGSAFSYATKLLSQRKVSGIHKYLAHTYAAEALVSLDRISEAIDHFNPDLITDVSSKFSEELNTKQPKFDSLINNTMSNNYNLSSTKEDWSLSISDAKAMAQYNLAVVYTIRGEWARANHLLSRIHPDSQVPVKDLMVYLNLCQGATDVAKNSLKQYCSEDVKLYSVGEYTHTSTQEEYKYTSGKEVMRVKLTNLRKRNHQITNITEKHILYTAT